MAAEKDNNGCRACRGHEWTQHCVCLTFRQHRKWLYTELLTSGRLNSYLADLGEQSESMFLEPVKQMKSEAKRS